MIDQWKYCGNRNGFVFVTVIMVIAIMAIITLSVISLNSSQSVNIEREIKRLQAESLAIGVTQTLMMNPSIGNSVTFSQTMDDVEFTVTTLATDDDSGPFGTDPLEVEVQY